MSGRRIKRPRQRANASPGLVSEPEKEAPLTDTIIPNCPSCAALRGTSRLLAESALYLIDRNAELTRQLEAYRTRDRRQAEMVSGLADLQRVEVGA